ncbi:MAG: hypothetical protein ACRDTC_04890 [Pseudonocardiaceae bacterium]
MDAALIAAALSLGASVIALFTAATAARAAKRAERARGNAEVQLDRITHQLAALDQAWYWTPQWQAGEVDADADLVAGRLVRFHSAAEMDAHLAGIPLPEQATSSTSGHPG